MLLASALTFIALSAHQGLAVMPLQPEHVSRDVSEVLDLLLASTLEQTERYEVIRPSDVNAMLGLQRMKDLVGCSDVSCTTEIAQALGVPYLLTGTVAELEGVVILDLALIDVVAVRVIKRAQVTIDHPNREADYASAVRDAVNRILEIPSPVLTVMQPPAPPPLRPKRLRFVTGEDTTFDLKLTTPDGVDHRCTVKRGLPCDLDDLPDDTTPSISELRIDAPSHIAFTNTEWRLVSSKIHSSPNVAALTIGATAVSLVPAGIIWIVLPKDTGLRTPGIAMVGVAVVGIVAALLLDDHISVTPLL